MEVKVYFMKKIIVVLTVLMCAAPLALRAVDAGNVMDNIIEDIMIKGVSSVSEKEVLDEISYGVGMLFSKYKTREDIRNLYKTGKFEDIKVYLGDEDGKKVLIYEFVEKPRIEKIYIKGNKDVGDGDIKSKLENPYAEEEAAAPAAPDREEEEKIKVKEGEYFDGYALKEAVLKIQKMYGDKNFYYAEVDYKAEEYEAEEGEKKVKIYVDVNEGPKMKVQSITAEGND